ncbi:hypothetical protein B0H15DRAFT_835210 [Mycena belliarum]|uniref:Uncharacterized protein n=1 Tax=Mycena belliarum TaxID=1033014 RepID=A0AAD6XTQ1_9AGAR|nr:hypothetical protein B0H15DRAFT_835210 [Mycena belliae]
MHISTPQDARGRPHRTSATATILGLVALLAPQRWSMKEHYECQWTLAGLDICEITSWIRGEVAHEKFSDSSTCNVHLVSKQRKIRRDEASRSCSSFCKSLYRVGWTSVWLVDPSRCECSTTRPGVLIFRMVLLACRRFSLTALVGVEDATQGVRPRPLTTANRTRLRSRLADDNISYVGGYYARNDRGVQESTCPSLYDRCHHLRLAAYADHSCSMAMPAKRQPQPESQQLGQVKGNEQGDPEQP